MQAAETEAGLFSRADVGGYLPGIWGLPKSIVEAAANYHEPKRLGRVQRAKVLDIVYPTHLGAGGCDFAVSKVCGTGPL